MRRALTLLEVLVAATLGMLVVALTWTAFAGAKRTTARATALVGLHQSAAVLQEAFARDFGSLAPALALFARSTPTTAAGSRSERIELTFMRSTAPLDKQASQGAYDRYLAEHHWMRWCFTRTLVQVDGAWRVSDARLTRAASTPVRFWRTTAALTVAPGVVDPLGGATRTSYNGVNWLNLPRPLRDASGGPASLDANRYGVPAAAVSPATPIGDIGDLADLLANEQVVSLQVRDLQLGWVDAGGGAVVLDGATAAAHDLDGLHLDVVGPDNGRYLDARHDPLAAPSAALEPGQPQYDYRPVLARRPRLMRLALRLEDRPTGVGQDFTFAVAVPGLAPPITRPAP